MSDWFAVAVSMQVIREMMESCESCEQREVNLFVHGTFVCSSCAEVA